MSIIGAILYIALLVAFVVGTIWTWTVLAELRRGQARLLAETDRIARAVGLPPRADQAVITCDRCGVEYSASLTGCDKCGRVRPKNAVASYPA